MIQRRKLLTINQYSQVAFATSLAIIFMGVMMFTFESYINAIIELEAATHLLAGE